MKNIISFLKLYPKYLFFFLVAGVILTGILTNLKDFFSQPIFIIIMMIAVLVGAFYFMTNMAIYDYKNRNNPNV